MHLTLGILRQSQAVSYALAFFWSDGFAVPAPAQVTQTVEKTMKHKPFLLFTAILLTVALACNAIVPTEEPPGVGIKAEQGYAASEPVIAALEQFKADKGSYPESLAELVPEYISAVPTKSETLDFSYNSTGESFSFSFHYIGPGMNTCTYTPEEQWKCSGAH
ncbi:MAG: hypothetical protein QY302_12815 [Anaerolineales bacterium]|nr:MAG: hypothetical protein QY302_12815 [Anaerolineales bacterium]